jgi:hypothetical protein
VVWGREQFLGLYDPTDPVRSGGIVELFTDTPIEQDSAEQFDYLGSARVLMPGDTREEYFGYIEAGTQKLYAPNYWERSYPQYDDPPTGWKTYSDGRYVQTIYAPSVSVSHTTAPWFNWQIVTPDLGNDPDTGVSFTPAVYIISLSPVAGTLPRVQISEGAHIDLRYDGTLKWRGATNRFVDTVSDAYANSFWLKRTGWNAWRNLAFDAWVETSMYSGYTERSYEFDPPDHMTFNPLVRRVDNIEYPTSGSGWIHITGRTQIGVDTYRYTRDDNTYSSSDTFAGVVLQTFSFGGFQWWLLENGDLMRYGQLDRSMARVERGVYYIESSPPRMHFADKTTQPLPT